MTYACTLTYRSFKTYLFWIVSFFATSIGLRLFHEYLHLFYTEITGGTAQGIDILDWILFYPIFVAYCSGGNPFLVFEGVLITTWLVSLLIVILTSYPFLRTVMNDCDAANVSGVLFGVRLGAIFEMFGQAIYALPNFVFFVDDYTLYGDGTVMMQVFESIGYPGEFQYVIAFMMLIGSFFALYWSLDCDPQICSCAYGVGR